MPLVGRAGCVVVALASLWCSVAAGAQVCQDGRTDTLRVHSAAMREDRVALIRLPQGYCQSTGRYPLLYIIDADQYLGTLAGTIDFLIANDRIPPLIVVGLTHPDRTHDLTPTPSSALTADGKPSPLPTSGGGLDFRAFLADELVPRVDRQYRTAPYRVLFGHSFGGLFAVDVMLTQPELFGAYIAASPSLWWDDERELREASRAIEQGRVPRAFLYLSIAAESGISRRAFAAFRDRLQSARGSGLSVVSQTFDDEEHVSSVIPAFYGGLKAVFSAWPIPRDNDSKLPLGGLAGLESHYAVRSRLLGYAVPVPENAYISLGNQELAVGKIAESVDALARAVDRYPRSARARDRLGTALLAKGDVAQARRLFQAAVAVGESEHDPQLGQYRQHLEALDRDHPPR